MQLFTTLGVVESSVLEQLEIVKAIAAKNGATEFKVLTNETDCAALWRYINFDDQQILIVVVTSI